MTRIAWVEAEPGRVEREQEAMAAVAPGMVWHDDLQWPDDSARWRSRPAMGWLGEAPLWTPDRPMPAGVEKLVGTRRLELAVYYPEAFPAAPAVLYPVDPEVPLDRRTLHQWHVNGDGSLCLMQAAADWQLEDTAADLVRKASCWFIEYLVVEAGLRQQMTERGLLADDSLDELLERHEP